MHCLIFLLIFTEQTPPEDLLDLLLELRHATKFGLEFAVLRLLLLFLLRHLLHDRGFQICRLVLQQYRHSTNFLFSRCDLPLQILFKPSEPLFLDRFVVGAWYVFPFHYVFLSKETLK